MALSKRMEWIMRPPLPRDDYEPSELFERWLSQVTLFENIGLKYKLAIRFKMTALRILMSNKVYKFDNVKEQAKHDIPNNTPQGDIPAAQYSVVIIRLREYLIDKRLEHNFKRNADDRISVVSVIITT